MSAADIFANEAGTWTVYRGTLQVREKLIGGIPLDPDTIKKWLSARLELGERELTEMAEETAFELAEQLERRPTAEEIVEVVAKKYSTGNGFKQVAGQLVYEGRCMKAALKEAANVAFPGVQWDGKPQGIKKGLMRYMAERVFVDEQYIPLGVTEPSDREPRIKRVMTAEGPRSAINVVDFVYRPRLDITVRVLDDCLSAKVWGRVWLAAEEIGIGADRARSDGKFDLISWTKETAAKRGKKAA